LIAEPPWPFLMTPAQHRQWAENMRRLKRHDLAQMHEQLARAIEIVERRRQAEAPTVISPPHPRRSNALRPRIDMLTANLAEAERAVAIYRDLACEPR
jgi:hypothetical protein